MKAVQHILKSAVACLLLAPATTFAGAGIYDSFVIVEGTFYDMGATTSNPDFAGASLGSFDSTLDDLDLGGQQKSFKNNSSDVTGHFLSWVIYETGNRPGAPGFSDIGYSFQWNNGDFGAPIGLNNAGDQQWGTDVQGSNGTDGAASIDLSSLANGNYTLELFSRITTNSVDAAPEIFNNNGGSNFTATFSIIPEPSSFGLIAAGLGALYFLRRKAH